MMKLKSLSTLITFFSLLLILSRIEARSDPREYWRSVMKDEPMPKTIQDVLPLEDAYSPPSGCSCFRSSFCVFWFPLLLEYQISSALNPGSLRCSSQQYERVKSFKDRSFSVQFKAFVQGSSFSLASQSEIHESRVCQVGQIRWSELYPLGGQGELPNEDLARQRLIRKEAEDLCLGHIKNSLSDRLYDLYAPIKSARELWKALEDKYKAHEEGTNKYLIAKYLDFQMVDDKSILEQVHELQVLVNKLTALSIPLPEIFQVGVIIAKLPPGWKDFSKRMMHKSEDYSLDELLKHLRIEEETRNRDKRGKVGSSVNHVAGGSGQKGKGASSKNKKFTAPKKKEFKKSQHTNNHQPKRSGKCHVCGETGHYARECSQRKSGSTVGSTSAIDVEKVTNLVANVGLEDGFWILEPLFMFVGIVARFLLMLLFLKEQWWYVLMDIV
ncbi:putative RNA-directed DNA polymerase [Helianthus annuus]|nr:putative RNA-directed DNA polymerase [Helianthus annuus]KAJ0459369.1 putative RNA-directed DNA polymerase [Helianthus annuus]